MLTQTDGGFPHGNSVMAEAVRAQDWAATPLGPIAGWSADLRIVIDMMLNSAFPKCVVWGTSRTTIYNDAFRPILGAKPEALGRDFLDVWAEVRDEIAPILRDAFAGRSTFIEDFPLSILRSGHFEDAYFTFCYSPIFGADGHVVGMMDTVIETTEAVVAKRNIEMLNSELQHRMKNSLAMIVGIANQTFRSAASKEDVGKLLIGRLRALDSAQDIMVRSKWREAAINDVVTEALRPHQVEGRISSTGPHVHLTARQSLALSLAIHELATNALKYGALSSPAGTVTIRWVAGRPGSEEPFTFRWHEQGGPPVSPPTRRGFGSRLIEDALKADFGGQVQVDYAASGLRVELTTPMARLGLVEEPL